MRITGGLARGRTLSGAVPAGVRPTTDRVREALFSLIGQDLRGIRVLDAFGGAGLVALDAWSRGADVTVVERDGRAFDALKRRVASVGASVTVVRGDVLALASRLGRFDGVYLDPPYAHDIVPALEALGPLATRWVVAEVTNEQAGTVERIDAVSRIPGMSLDRSRTYGATTLLVFRADEATTDPTSST
jgi:16S rRNA (guanine(966)-N(2))-methyltransferase RsmD